MGKEHQKIFSPASSLAIFYLATPLLIFFICFVNWRIAIFAALLIIYVGYQLIIKTDWKISSKKNLTWQLAYILFLSFLWCYLGGYFGGGAGQTADWYKHYAVVNFLADNNFLLRATVDPLGDVMLRYYLGYYLVPAAILKTFPTIGAQIIMGIWTALGVSLFFQMLVGFYPTKKIKYQWLIIAPLVFFLFSDMRYSPNAGMLFWAPQHTLPSWLGLGILWPTIINKKIDHKPFTPAIISYFGLLAAAMIFWSPFSFVGMLPFMIIIFCRHLFLQPTKSQLVKYILDKQNILSLAILVLPILVYLHAGGSGNLFSLHVSALSLKFFILYVATPMAIVFYHYFITPAKQRQLNLHLLFIISGILFIMTIPVVGTEFYRATAVSLCILAIIMTQILITGKKLLQAITVIFLLLSSTSSIKQIADRFLFPNNLQTMNFTQVMALSPADASLPPYLPPTFTNKAYLIPHKNIFFLTSKITLLR